jgi:hypothetical protein
MVSCMLLKLNFAAHNAMLAEVGQSKLGGKLPKHLVNLSPAGDRLRYHQFYMSPFHASPIPGTPSPALIWGRWCKSFMPAALLTVHNYIYRQWTCALLHTFTSKAVRASNCIFSS